MLRRPATVITLTPDDLAAFESRSIQRIAAHKAQAEYRAREQKELQRRRREEQERASREHASIREGSIENVMGASRSGRRRRGHDQETESPGLGSVAGKAKAKGRRLYGGGPDIGMESSMVGEFDGTSSYADPFGSALGSSPRRRQERQVEEERQDDDGMEIDLDADVPDADGGVDLDADVPDMDADAGQDESASEEEDDEEDPIEDQEEDEDDVVLHTSNVDTSGIDVDMDTPTAPTRGSQRADQQRPPIAAAVRRVHAFPPPPQPQPTVPPITRPSRRTRIQQQPSQPQHRPIGYDGASDYALPPRQVQARPSQPSAPGQAQLQTRGAQPQPPVFPSLFQPQAGRVPDPRYRRGAQAAAVASRNHARTYRDFNDNDHDADALEHAGASTPVEQYQPRPPQTSVTGQTQTQAETELQRRRRIQEETMMVAERERARRARIMGQGQGQRTSQQQQAGVGGAGQHAGSYGGVPGAPARSVAGGGGVGSRPVSRR